MQAIRELRDTAQLGQKGPKMKIKRASRGGDRALRRGSLGHDGYIPLIVGLARVSGERENSPKPKICNPISLLDGPALVSSDKTYWRAKRGAAA